MKHTNRLLKALTALLLLPAIVACSNLSQRQQNAAVGAGIGAVAGSVLTGGSAVGTLGGAAIGGIIGNGSDDSRRQRR
jgi:osmotically inducible lipoprotein OsmB